MQYLDDALRVAVTRDQLATVVEKVELDEGRVGWKDDRIDLEA